MNYFLFLLLVFVILYKFIHIYEGFDGGCIKPIVPNFSNSKINYENIKSLYSGDTIDISDKLDEYIKNDFNDASTKIELIFSDSLYDEANCRLDYLNL
jgi:hypothetical protein